MSFRAQLVLEEQRRLFDVWLDAAAGARMPTRQAFQPKQFAALLPWVSLVGVEALITGDVAPALKVKVAGSQLRDVLGVDPARQLLCPQAAGGATSFLTSITTGEPGCGATFVPDAKGGAGMMRFWLRLPLGGPGSVEQVIGLDIAVSRMRAPDWALQRIAV
jgi:hypothetical protein